MNVSIDIGMTYSSMSMLNQNGKVRLVELECRTNNPELTSNGVASVHEQVAKADCECELYEGNPLLPTAVFFEEDGNMLVGQEAIRTAIKKPEHLCLEFKRNFGEETPISIGRNSLDAEKLYEKLFKHMKNCVEKITAEEIECTYLTYPACYKKEHLRQLFGLPPPFPQGRLRRSAPFRYCKFASFFDVHIRSFGNEQKIS